MKKMKHGDLLLYLDGGCELKQTGIKRLMEYFDIVKNSKYGILSFRLDHLPEKQWTKMDTFIALQGLEHKNSGQLISGAFVIKKCDHTLFLIHEWYKYMCNYHLIDDSPSIKPNDLSFREHRHDQSIFSLIRKKYGTETLLDETWLCYNYDCEPIWDDKMPIWATRRKIQ